MQVLKSYPACNLDKKWIYMFFKYWWSDHKFWKYNCSDRSYNKSTEYITRIVNSSYYSCACCDKSQNYKYTYQWILWVISPYCNDRCSREEGMPRRKWVPNRMRNEWRNSSCNIIWTCSPLWHSEVDDAIYDEYQYDRHKYPQRLCFVFLIFDLDSVDPETDEHECNKNHYRFPKNLNEYCVFWPYEPTSRDEKWLIEREKVL